MLSLSKQLFGFLKYFCAATSGEFKSGVKRANASNGQFLWATTHYAYNFYL